MATQKTMPKELATAAVRIFPSTRKLIEDHSNFHTFGGFVHLAVTEKIERDKKIKKL